MMLIKSGSKQVYILTSRSLADWPRFSLNMGQIVQSIASLHTRLAGYRSTIIDSYNYASSNSNFHMASVSVKEIVRGR